MSTGVKRFTELRAWQACDAFKKAIYNLCDGTEAISRDFSRRKQIEDASSRTTAHIAEGFGRFFPADFARFCGIARSSLMESQNHLIDFVDKKYISDGRRLELNQLAETALEELTGLIEYLQSPEALRNARRARERRVASRPERRQRNAERGTKNANTEPNANLNTKNEQ
jgi:four helix bundle protein